MLYLKYTKYIYYSFNIIICIIIFCNHYNNNLIYIIITVIEYIFNYGYDDYNI